MIGTKTVVVAGLLVGAVNVRAQQPLDLESVAKALEKDGRFSLERSNVVLLKYDFVHDGDAVEAIAFRPAAESKSPAVLLIPGYSRTAKDYIPLGVRLAKEGIACVAVTQRGFGKSAGKPDFVGPKTVASLEACFKKFRDEPYVDSQRMGVFGYSRGAMAASLLAVRPGAKDLKAAVFAAGIYDFQRAYDEIKLAGIRENMEAESGMTESAIAERSSIGKMDRLACPVLILHGEKDENAPLNQAHLLKDRLKALGKDFALKTFPDRDHDIGRQNLNEHTIAFFKQKLAPTQTAKTK